MEEAGSVSTNLLHIYSNDSSRSLETADLRGNGSPLELVGGGGGSSGWDVSQLVFDSEVIALAYPELVLLLVLVLVVTGIVDVDDDEDFFTLPSLDLDRLRPLLLLATFLSLTRDIWDKILSTLLSLFSFWATVSSRFFSLSGGAEDWIEEWRLCCTLRSSWCELAFLQ